MVIRRLSPVIICYMKTLLHQKHSNTVSATALKCPVKINYIVERNAINQNKQNAP